MLKKEITRLLRENYKSFTRTILDLSDSEYQYTHNGKWNAGEQLEHLLLCTRPLVGVFGMDKAKIETLFGKSEGTKHSFEELAEIYRAKLSDGGQAPDKYVPGEALNGTKAEKCQEMLALVSSLCSRIEYLTDDDLDSLQIPHPLLGNLTLREMLYNMIYHVKHHHDQSIENLRERT
jgi:hypothetical protein